MKTIKNVIQALVVADDESIRTVLTQGALSGAVDYPVPLTRGDKLQIRSLVENTIAVAVRAGARIGLGETTLKDFLEDAIGTELQRRAAAGEPGIPSGIEPEIEADDGAAPEIDVTDANKG